MAKILDPGKFGPIGWIYVTRTSETGGTETEAYLLDEYGKIIVLKEQYWDPGKTEIVLSDFRYWAPIQDELDEWLAEHGLVREGTVVSFGRREELFALFKLRWL